MDIVKTLNENMGLQMVTPIVNYIGNDKKRLDQLVEILDKGDKAVQHRASYALLHVALANTTLVIPYTPLFLNILNRTNVHESTKRNVLRCFQEFNCPDDQAGELLDCCYGLMKNAALPPALIAFAINVAAPICKRYPELIPEFELILKELYQFHTAPSITACIKRAQKTLLKKTKN